MNIRPGYTEVSHHGGLKRTYTLANGRGASVIKHQFSYGGNAGLWELAVLDDKGDLDYTTHVTEDVLGWLNEEEVNNALAMIEALPAKNTEPLLPPSLKYLRLADRKGWSDATLAGLAVGWIIAQHQDTEFFGFLEKTE